MNAEQFHKRVFWVMCAGMTLGAALGNEAIGVTSFIGGFIILGLTTEHK